MRFIYQITSFPEKTDGYNLIAYTEGTLRLLLGAVPFLEMSGVLLVELAVVLHKWLHTLEHEPTDFYYASMDFEEEPIVALRYDSNRDHFMPESVWAEVDAVPVPRFEAKLAAEAYLAELREDLGAKHGVDLDRALEEAVLDEAT